MIIDKTIKILDNLKLEQKQALIYDKDLEGREILGIISKYSLLEFAIEYESVI